jgi:hypothetical protein
MSQSTPGTTGAVEHINAVPNPREGRGEIIDLTTREVWQDRNPTPRAWWNELSLEAPLLKAGYGAGNMDRMWFRRSPDAEVDGPVREREIAGRQFFCCARAPGDMGQGNPRRLMVDKHHTLLYQAGREVQILTTAEGKDFVLVVDGVPDAPAPALPEGWRVRGIKLEEDWIVELPAPTETYWFEGMISYQGPVENLPGGS